jgi:uncharacterized protein YgiM (DUF1202 family)
MAKREMPKKTNEEVVENVTQTVVEDKAPETKNGVVVGCTRLNIRKGCTTESKVVDVVNAKANVTVFVDNPVAKEWLSVKTENGKKGYCMKQYIKY